MKLKTLALVLLGAAATYSALPVHAQAEIAQVGLGVQFTQGSCAASAAAIIGSVAADGTTVGLFVPYNVPGTSTAGWSHLAAVSHDGRPACQRRLGTWHFLSEE